MDICNVTVKWLDDEDVFETFIAESDDASERLPYGYGHEDIFYYGICEEKISEAIKNQSVFENNWLIVKLNGVIKDDRSVCNLCGTEIKYEKFNI